MTPAGSPGTASDAYRVPVQEGRHRAPPPPPTPPRLLPLHTPIAAAAVLLIAASVIAIYAPGAAWDVQAEGGVTVPTASRTARTVQIPLTVLPPAATAMSTATPSTPAGARQTWAGVSVVAEARVSVPTTPSEVTQAIPTTTDRPPTTLPEVPPTDSTTAASPASTSEAAATTSSAPTSTEETTPMTTTEPLPTDVVGDVTDVIGEVGP